jgi:hypothetical protein
MILADLHVFDLTGYTLAINQSLVRPAGTEE